MVPSRRRHKRFAVVGTTFGIVSLPSCPKCSSSELDEAWGSHDDDCPPGDHRHFICTNPDCLLDFTVAAPPAKLR